MSITTADTNRLPADAGERIDPRRLFAFLAMCFGMFMGAASRHPDRVGIALRDPGRAGGFARRDFLGADLLPDRRGGRHSAVGLSLPGARNTLHVRGLRRRLHRREPDVRLHLLDERDDLLARRPGLHRRRHGSDRVRLHLHDLSALQAGHDRSHDRAHRHAGADHRPDDRRLPHRRAVVALAVLHQCRARHRGQRAHVRPHRLRPAGPVAVQAFRLVGAWLHGGLPGHARIRAGGGAALRLVRRPHHRALSRGLGPLGGGLLRPRAHGTFPDRRPQGLCRPQLRARQHVLIRARHRALRADLPGPGLSR